MNNQKKDPNAARWCIHYSTYYWRIYLDKTNPLNSPNVTFLTGYSKKENQREATDLNHLLKAKILNLHKNGYLDRCDRIEIYKRAGEIINTKLDHKIFVLYRDHFDINPAISEWALKMYAPFLNDFYNRRRHNLSMEGIIKLKKMLQTLDDLTDPTKVKIHDLKQLYSYAARLLVNGHTDGQVNAFVTKYRQLKNW